MSSQMAATAANTSSSASTGFYDDYAVRNFAVMAVVWGVIGMLIGVIVASQLAFPELNLGLPWTSLVV